MAVDIQRLTDLGLIQTQQERIAAQPNRNELGQEDFFKLMTAQLQAQDPTAPQDGSEMVAQMSQFSMVTGIDKLNDTMGGLAPLLTGGQSMQAANLVGRSILTESGTGFLPASGDYQGVVDLSSSAVNVQVEISDSVGQLVKKLPLGILPGGQNGFTWNGLDESGQRVPPGNYQMQTTAQVDGQTVSVPTLTAAKVDSVSIGTGNNVLLNVNGVGSIPFSQVTQIQ
jgi:flagellar basal-body rod modification protein FlgD